MHENFYHNVKVYYDDTDAGEVDSYADWLKYLERARTEALASIGLSNLQIKEKFGALIIVKSCNIDCKKSAFLEADLQNIHLKIIGNGPDLEYLKTKYADKNNIVFHGFLDNFDTLNFISTSIAVITATKLYEGQPTLLCEASLLGVPSIFPDSGGIKEFFPADYPFSYTPFDKNSLVGVIKKVENKWIRS